MTVALLIEDAERGVTVVHSLHSSREPWMKGYTVQDVPTNSGVREGWVLSANGKLTAPVEVQPPAAPAITYKADIYRRCTNDEAEAIEMALAAAPVRERRLFESAQFLDHSAPEFASMRSAIIEMFGDKRAETLLAAS